MSCLQALEPEVLQSDGLDLNLAEQLADMSLHEEALREPSVSKLTDVFDADASSSKVPVTCYDRLMSNFQRSAVI